MSAPRVLSSPGGSPPAERDEGVPLLPQMGRHRLVDVREERVDPGRPGSFGLLDRVGDLVAELLFAASLPPLVATSSMLEVLAESGDRSAGPSRPDVRFLAVSRRAAARAVRSEAVRQCL